MSRSSVSQTSCSARNQAEAIESCGKSAQTSAECNKLIMVSRVPGYGRFEYLVLGFSCESHHVTLINIVGF